MAGSSPAMTPRLTYGSKSRDDGLETLANLLFRQLAADEHELAVALLAVLPGALMVAVQDHVHTLEHEAVGIVLEIEDALAAQDGRTVLGDELLYPGEELVGAERLVGLERERLHVLVVIVLEPAVVVMVVVPIAMVMIVIMVVIGGKQKLRLDVEDAIKIECVAAENFVQRDLRALGAMQLGVGVDRANARLDLAQFGFRHQVGLVEENYVG